MWQEVIQFHLKFRIASIYSNKIHIYFSTYFGKAPRIPIAIILNQKHLVPFRNWIHCVVIVKIQIAIDSNLYIAQSVITMNHHLCLPRNCMKNPSLLNRFVWNWVSEFFLFENKNRQSKWKCVSEWLNTISNWHLIYKGRIWNIKMQTTAIYLMWH